MLGRDRWRATWQRKYRLVVACGLLLAAGCSDLTGRGSVESGAASDDSADEISAEQIIEKMRAVYAAVDMFTGTAEVTEETVRRGEGVQRELPYYSMSVAYERPNRINFSFKESLAGSDGEIAYTVVSDGIVTRASATEVPDQVFEATAPLELTIDNFIQEPQLRDAILQVAPVNFFPHLVMLMDPDQASSLFPEDSRPRRVGIKTLRERPCYRVALDNPNGERVLWIDQESFLLHRVEAPSEAARMSMDPQGSFSHFLIRIDFLNTDLEAEISPSSFVMEIPSASRRVERFVEPPPKAPPAWLGRPAGDFEVRTLAGESMGLEELQGRPVLLDFWFMQCPPCRLQTPVLEEVYQELQDTQLKVYAVSIDNARIPDDAVEKTLRNWGGTMPILRDENESAFAGLGVEKTPTVLILDAAGRVQYRHEGAQRTSQELLGIARQVLAGADLASQARAEHQQLVEQYQKDVEAVTIKDSLLKAEVLDDTATN